MYQYMYYLCVNLYELIFWGWVGVFFGIMGYREIEIKFDRYICMFKVLGVGQNFDYEIYNVICKDLY